MSDVIRVGGLELRFLQTGPDTNGALDMFEMTVPPQGRMPLPHYHRDWEETIFGLSGVVTWTVAGKTLDIGPGQSVFIPRGTVHGFDNRTAQPASCLCVLTPGVLGPQYFLDLAAELARSTPPDPARMRAVMERYGLFPVQSA